MGEEERETEILAHERAEEHEEAMAEAIVEEELRKEANQRKKKPPPQNAIGFVKADPKPVAVGEEVAKVPKDQHDAVMHLVQADMASLTAVLLKHQAHHDDKNQKKMRKFYREKYKGRYMNQPRPVDGWTNRDHHAGAANTQLPNSQASSPATPTRRLDSSQASKAPRTPGRTNKGTPSRRTPNRGMSDKSKKSDAGSECGSQASTSSKKNTKTAKQGIGANLKNHTYSYANDHATRGPPYCYVNSPKVGGWGN